MYCIYNTSPFNFITYKFPLFNIFKLNLNKNSIVNKIKRSYKTIFSERSDVNEIECILFSMAIPLLLVSGSLWVTWNFWMWLALAVKQHVCLLKE